MNEDIIFSGGTAKLKDLLSLIRSSGYCHSDEGSMGVIICPECEEWTHVKFNSNSGLLDFFGDLTVESIDVSDGDILLWVKTDDFNYFRIQ